MSTPPVIPNFNDTTPVATTGRKNAKWNVDLLNPADISVNFQNIGSVNNQTGTSYTLALGDQGKLTTFSNASPVAVTLDSTVPNDYYAACENLGVGLVTLTPSSGLINGAANMTLSTGSGCWLFFNGTNWYSVNGSGGTGGGGGLNGVVVKTANYTAVSGDNGKLIVFNSVTPVTLTLPASPPSATWCIFTENINVGTLTVSPNGLQLDGVVANLTVNKDQGCYISTDNTNYFTERGMGSGTSFIATTTFITIPSTTSGDFSVAHGLSSTPDTVDVFSTSDGIIRFQPSPSPPWDSSNVYLNASDNGLTGFLEITSVSSTGGGGTGVIIGFVINIGTAGTNVGPMLVAPRAGSVTKCVIVTKASDPSIALNFRIMKNGVDVFTINPTVTAGTAPGTISSTTSLTTNPMLVGTSDVFSIDILAGSGLWMFTAQLE